MKKNETGLVMKYFLLHPLKKNAYGKASRAALMAYAQSIGTTNKTLANDLIAWVEEIGWLQ